MKLGLSARSGFGSAGLALLFACTDGPTSPTAPSGVPADLELDPAPSAPGIFLGSGVTPATCINGAQPDTDRDALADSCERSLAAAFAPELAYAASDRTTREPRWAARPLSGGRVRLAYLLSLHLDLGVHGCSLGW
jgi:hypothetical protein